LVSALAAERILAVASAETEVEGDPTEHPTDLDSRVMERTL
jgi:hypothetical protein